VGLNIEWLKQSKGIQVLFTLFLVVYLVTTILDWTIKYPQLLEGKRPDIQTQDINQTASKLVVTLQQTNLALDQIIISNTAILRAVSDNKALLESLNNMTHTMYNRQVTEDRFQGEIDALKKKVSSLQK
jgi:hypothetical protein